MSRQEIAALKARWTVEALTAADRAFVKMDPVAAYQGKPPPYPFESPFGKYDGRADFRYYSLGQIPFNRILEHGDFTGATDDRNGQLCCSLVNCRLDRASMETNLGNKIVQGCTFVRAKFTHTSLRGEFIDCDFSDCDLSHSRSAQAKFIRCNFSGTKFVDAGFDYCIFDNCLWSGARIGNGAFPYGKFIGSWPEKEQLANAMIPSATFDGLSVLRS
jgi:uncharacterized protein YjbI with pentapeptide repeats